MGKISNNELASVLINRKGLSRKNAARFVNEMFNVIRQGLQNERLVKVKGLGTFKIIDVDDRESVNVNTGERVLIEGHSKISFTPDALMKELVNKPFSQFETVVLKDGVVFEDTPQGDDVEAQTPLVEQEPTEFVEIPEPAVEPEPVPEPTVESEPEPVPEPVVEPEPVVDPEPVAEPTVEPESFYEDDLEPSAAPLVEFVTPSEDSPANEPEDIPEDTVEDIPADEPVFDFDDEESGSRWKKWAMIAALCCLCFVGGYFVGRHFAIAPVAQTETKSEVKSVAQPKPQVVKPEVKSEPQADMKSEAQPEPQPEPQPEVKSEAKPEEKAVAQPESKPEAQPEPKPVAQAEPSVALDKYEQMDVRIRTGAYRIVGTDHVEKVKAGDNLSRICKRTIGPDMECYLEVYNGIKGDADLKVGQEIKIPKLERKKKKVKKDN